MSSLNWAYLSRLVCARSLLLSPKTAERNSLQKFVIRRRISAVGSFVRRTGSLFNASLHSPRNRLTSPLKVGRLPTGNQEEKRMHVVYFTHLFSMRRTRSLLMSETNPGIPKRWRSAMSLHGEVVLKKSAASVRDSALVIFLCRSSSSGRRTQ
jgi:hypothetical protein